MFKYLKLILMLFICFVFEIQITYCQPNPNAGHVLSGPQSPTLTSVPTFIGPNQLNSSLVLIDNLGNITTPTSISASNLLYLTSVPIGNNIFYMLTNLVGFGAANYYSNAPIYDIQTTFTAISNGTNFVVDFSKPETDFTPLTNVYFIYSTNFNTVGSQQAMFLLKGSSSNFKLSFGTDFTNLYGAYTTNNYILSASNCPHMIAVQIRGGHGSELISILPPNN